VWAVGDILAYLLEKWEAFEHVKQEDSETLLSCIADSQRPVRLPESFARYSPGLQQLLRSCYQKDPGQRPSAQQLLQLPVLAPILAVLAAWQAQLPSAEAPAQPFLWDPQGLGRFWQVSEETVEAAAQQIEAERGDREADQVGGWWALFSCHCC
jgi:serine/threonine protein kinase